MKDTFFNANFPRTVDGRVYHLGIRPGEVANKIVTVGSPSRAEAIARLLDHGEQSDHHGDVYRPVPAVFRLSSERGFLTITGRFRGVPVSILSIGMGYPNMDFFVREVRECVTGDLVIVRLGSCGGLRDHPVGMLVTPRACVSIQRNFDYEFLSETHDGADGPPYHISKPVAADAELHASITKKLRSSIPLEPPAIIADDTVNASADTFYASQGRQTSFPDHNETLIDDLIKRVPDVATLEMETFHLFHLASVWRPRPLDLKLVGLPVPPTSLPVTPSLTPPPYPVNTSSSSREASNPSSQTLLTPPPSASPRQPDSGAATPASTVTQSTSRIRAAAVQMIFAQRSSLEFITPTRVRELEEWSGRAILEALSEFHIPKENLHAERGSVWERRKLHLT